MKEVSGKWVAKPYYAHLFNDAIVISSVNRGRSVMGVSYTFDRAIELENATVELASVPGISNSFSITSDGKKQFFRVVNIVDSLDWVKRVQEIIDQIAAEEVAKRSKRSSVKLAPVVASTAGSAIQYEIKCNGSVITASQLNARTVLVYNFLKTEYVGTAELALLNTVMIQPLFNASKGAQLAINSLKSTAKPVAKISQQRRGSTLVLMEGRMANIQIQQIKENLQSTDMQIFLRATETLAKQLGEFVAALEAAANHTSWSDGMLIGPVFSSVAMHAICRQFESYVSGHQAAVRILSGQLFSQFIKDVEEELGTNTLFVKFKFPAEGAGRYLEFLEALLKQTSISHPDYASLVECVDRFKKLADAIKVIEGGKKNFEKLLEIQSKFVAMVSQDPVVQKLVSMERLFLREAELKKVCRKENKRFMFWLFSDYLLYASALGGGTYSLNRAIVLSTASAIEHTSTSIRNAFDILGSEKSFTVICSSGKERDEWLQAINDACAADRLAKGISGGAVVAPVWVADKHSDQCSICNSVSNVFTLN